MKKTANATSTKPKKAGPAHGNRVVPLSWDSLLSSLIPPPFFILVAFSPLTYLVPSSPARPGRPRSIDDAFSLPVGALRPATSKDQPVMQGIVQ